AFNGETANGTWTLEVSDNAYGDVGSLTSFSLNITSTSEPNVLTNSAGNYTFLNAAAGAWKIRADLASNPTWAVNVPASGQNNYTMPANSAVAGLNFGIKRPVTVFKVASSMGARLGQGSSSNFIQIPDQVVSHVATVKVRKGRHLA
ncbi:MAG: proprotein convertase P-domain-containing protein, partial [Planctomycetota bacterium]|nr:proprotein convertase P-domain-containing protein [Planctomycetota bacterium]